MQGLKKISLLAALAASSAFADLVTTPGTGTLEDLSSRTGIGYGFTFGPLTLPSGIILTAAGGQTGDGAVVGTGTYGLGENGSWTGPSNPYIGVNNFDNAWIRLELPTLVSEVTAFMNYHPSFTHATIVALNSSMVALESYNLSTAAPISTPFASNGGAYRGISRAAGDIKYFELRNAYLIANQIRFVPAAVSAVPEPTSAIVLSCGLAGAFLFRRRRAICK